MSKTAIIGGASGYTWNDLKYWVNSIRQTDFDGDIVIVTDNMTVETQDKLLEKNVLIHAFGNRDSEGNVVNLEKNLPPHVSRFFYIWDFLNRNEYDIVTVTDTRDVIFQGNPDMYVKFFSLGSIIGAREGLTYENEPWGKSNLFQSFGPYFYNRIKDKEILNVGVIGGDAASIKDLMLLIFQLSFNRPIPIVDQAVYNFIRYEFAKSFHFMDNESPWAINLGTTIEAVKAGYGDLGQACRYDHKLLEKYEKDYLLMQPVIKGDTVMNSDGGQYYVVHQYDRVPKLKDMIQIKYGD